ncbi:MAG: trypsin-like peptidase domain-containing protein [Fimbriimonadaceae bacterium]|nr:trypsin-like peptidase domain-containing protein [Fimbriimonadaceae bacterium]
MTCYHVVEDGTQISVDATGPASVELAFFDEKSDIAILRLPWKLPNFLELLAGNAPSPGTRIYVIGNALGFLTWTITDGIVSGLRKQPNSALLQITAPINEGSSGSPVLNEAGKVVGVARSLLENAQSLYFAISSWDVRKALNMVPSKAYRAGVDPTTGTAVLGTLGQALEAASIYQKPDSTSKEFYHLTANEYLVLAAHDTGNWKRVLLQNGLYGYIQSSKVAVLPYEVTANSGTYLSTSASIALLASSLVGVPYKAGGKDARFGVGVPELAVLSYAAGGITLPKSLTDQARVGKRVSRLEELEEGDRLYFGDGKSSRLTLTGIYLGNGYFVYANSSSKKVESAYLGSPSWLQRLQRAVRGK